MDNVWAYLVPILVNVIHVKLGGQQGVPLDGNHRILFAIDIFGIDINFGAIESGLAHFLRIRDLQLIHDFTHMLLRLFPDLWLTDVFLAVVRIPFRELVSYLFLHAQGSQAVFCQGKAILELLHHLVWPYDQMPLRNGKLAHTGQTMHFAGILIAEQGGSLTVAQRQVTVGMLLCFVDIILEGAGHWTERQYLFVAVLISQHEHTIGIMIPMPGNFIKVGLGHQRRLGPDIAPFIVF